MLLPSGVNESEVCARLNRKFLDTSSPLVICGRDSTVAVLRRDMFKSPRSILLLSKESKYGRWGSSSKFQYGNRSHWRMPSASRDAMPKSEAAVRPVPVDGDGFELSPAITVSRILEPSIERLFGGEMGTV